MGSPIISSPALRSTLSRNIKHQLQLLEWSENECARRSGVSQKQVNNLMNGRTGCSVEALDWMAHAMNIPPFVLLLDGFEELPQDRIFKLARIVDDYLKLDAATMNIFEAALQVAGRASKKPRKKS